MLWPDKFVRDQDIFSNQRARHYNMNTAKRHSSIMTGDASEQIIKIKRILMLNLYIPRCQR
jgi:hypothetical protein